MSGIINPTTVGAAIDVVGKIVDHLATRPPQTPAEITQDSYRLEQAMQLLKAQRAAIVLNYHEVQVRLERFQRDAADARRAVDKAKGEELVRHRRRQLRELEDEVEHLEQRFAEMAAVRNQVNRASELAQLGQQTLRRLSDKLEVERQGLLADRAGAGALEALERSYRDLGARRDELGHQVATERGRTSAALDDAFVKGLALEYDERNGG